MKVKIYADDPHLEENAIRLRTISRNIKLLRQRAGLTQQQLADAIRTENRDSQGTAMSEIVRWETGKELPNLYSAVFLTHALKCTYNDLFRIRGDKLL